MASEPVLGNTRVILSLIPTQIEFKDPCKSRIPSISGLNMGMKTRKEAAETGARKPRSRELDSYSLRFVTVIQIMLLIISLGLMISR